MISTADYHRMVVLPSLAEFYANGEDLRLAMHAAISLTHAIDYAFQNRAPEPRTAGAAAEAYRRDLVDRCYAFGVVEGFAMASKHCTMSRSDLRGFSSGHHERFYPAVADLSFPDRTFADDPVGGIHIRWKDDEWVSLVRALQVSCSMLEKELPELTTPAAPLSAANEP